MQVEAGSEDAAATKGDAEREYGELSGVRLVSRRNRHLWLGPGWPVLSNALPDLQSPATVMGNDRAVLPD